MKAIVVYPKVVLRMEMLEFFAYERFAFNALQNAAKLIESDVLAEVDMSENYGIAINVNISRGESNDAGYKIETNIFTPPLLLATCKYFGDLLSNSERLNSFLNNPVDFQSFVAKFQENIAKSKEIYISQGFGPWIESLYDAFNIRIHSLNHVADVYDLCTKFVTLHEVAHAFTGQLSLVNDFDDSEFRAFEYFADSIAVLWFHKKMITLMPDSEEYRNAAGHVDHNHGVFSNSLLVMNAFVVVLLFLGLSKSKLSNLDFSGGSLHPSSIKRFLIQINIFNILLTAGENDVFHEEYVKILNSIQRSFLYLCRKNGLIQGEDMLNMNQCKVYFEELSRIPEIIKKYSIGGMQAYSDVVQAVFRKFKEENS